MNNVDKLKVLQASLMVLSQKLKNFHWNLEGPTFFELHEETGKLADELSELTDTVAEKIVMHKSPALGTMTEALKLSKVVETPSQWVDSNNVAKHVEDDLRKIMKLAEEVEGTPTVQPVLDEVYLVCDKYAWQFSKLLKTSCAC